MSSAGFRAWGWEGGWVERPERPQGDDSSASFHGHGACLLNPWILMSFSAAMYL